MKSLLEWLFWLTPVLLIVALVYFIWHSFLPQTKPLVRPPKLLSTKIKTGKHDFSYFYYRLSELQRFKLIDNHKLEPSAEVMANSDCQIGINAGFYDPQGKPLGLLVIDGQVLSEFSQSRLLDGFFWISDLGGLGITRELPDFKFNQAFQSGPLLIENGIANQLTIKNDKQARRSVIATLSDGSLWLLIIYSPEARFLGPKLAKLPQVVLEIAQQEQVLIIEALNLDGGSASMFKSPKVFLEEYKPVRTILCVTTK